jgi:hypothetical protein
VEPVSALVARLGDLVELVEGPGVDVAGLGADQERPALWDRSQRLAERGGEHPPLAVARHPPHPVSAQPHELEGGIEGDVRLVARDHLDLRRAEEPAGLDVPAGAGEERVPGRGEADEIGDLAAGSEANARRAGKAEQQNLPGY